jgi:hypothetical protein
MAARFSKESCVDVLGFEGATEPSVSSTGNDRRTPPGLVDNGSALLDAKREDLCTGSVSGVLRASVELKPSMTQSWK